VDLSVCRSCHCLAARRAARAITRLYEERLRPHGLRATQFSILAALTLKGPTPLGELAELLGLERTTLTRSAALLERKGWIAPAFSADARRHPLRLTPAGRRKLARAFPAWKSAQQLVGRKLARGDSSITGPIWKEAGASHPRSERRRR
jgi:DNA-binding MarR family transcriptional regulator